MQHFKFRVHHNFINIKIMCKFSGFGSNLEKIIEFYLFLRGINSILLTIVFKFLYYITFLTT